MSVLTMEAVRAKYPEDKYILIMPLVTKADDNDVSMWALEISEVKIDPNDDALCHEIQGDSEHVGLTRVAIQRLADAAGVNVLPRDVSDPAKRDLAVFVAVAGMTDSSGTIRCVSASAEWDGEVARDEIRAAAMSYVEKGIANTWQGFSEPARARLTEQRFLEQWAKERKYGKRKAETAACSRAIRARLSLPGKYLGKDLKNKTFIVAKWIFAPDLKDPATRQQVVNFGLQAQRMLFGQVAQPLLLQAGAPDGGAPEPVGFEGEAVQADEEPFLPPEPPVAAVAPPPPPAPAPAAAAPPAASQDPPAPVYPDSMTWQEFLLDIASISMRVAKYQGPRKSALDKAYREAIERQDGATILALIRKAGV